jgi:hypothetical protein
MELIMKQQKSWTETAIRFAVDIPVNKSYLETNLYSLGMNGYTCRPASTYLILSEPRKTAFNLFHNIKSEYSTIYRIIDMKCLLIVYQNLSKV